MSELRSCSYGGGVQSTALLVLAAQGRIDFPLFLFANVGDDSEHPATLAYVDEVAAPYAEAHGIELAVVRYARRDGKGLYGRVMQPGGKGKPIPIRGENGNPMQRGCTHQWKVKPVEDELRRRGASPDEPAIVALGISVDEIERAKHGLSATGCMMRIYPLLDLGLSRHQCVTLIAKAGLPVPRPSSCWFCPFHDREAWRRLRSDTPELFAKACAMEATLIERRRADEQRPVYLTRHGRPLAETVDDQLVLDGMDGCDSGWCMT